MKTYRTLLFMLSVIAMLAILCAFFPREGVRLGRATLSFPSLEEILIGDESEPAESPEELLARRLAAIKEAKENDFLDYFRTEPARLHFPEGDLTFLDPLFEAFDDAGSRRMRIVHYGDSQIEEDRISKVLRDSLQTRFGGGGPGLLPVREEYYNYSISESSTVEPARYIVYGTPQMRGGNSRYGVMGQRTHFDSTATTSFFPVRTNNAPSRRFNRLTLLSSGGELYASCKGITVREAASENVRHTVFELPDSTERVSITHSGSRDIYGIMLDGDTGISVDNIAMRGSGGTVFTAISAAQLKDFYTVENVRLIILQFGGNVVPYTKGKKAISQYKDGIERQIKYLREQAPDASILFIGPSDMSTNIQGKMQTYTHLPMLVDSLKAAAVNAGAAFWDMYEAMGGSGSMARWVQETPPLAGPDHVHFTPRGAEKIGGMLYETIMLYYDYYRLRKDE